MQRQESRTRFLTPIIDPAEHGVIEYIDSVLKGNAVFVNICLIYSPNIHL
ncbi:hypothetical protein [Endozoicomonas sp. GU-1]|nr:hypothetical protein [Endozoicomonas sp. GU-1]WBA88469.1 hypothetical protein O3276_10970 [Endozoicomonas sp. GU-1]